MELTTVQGVGISVVHTLVLAVMAATHVVNKISTVVSAVLTV